VNKIGAIPIHQTPAKANQQLSNLTGCKYPQSPIETGE
jgi:hypothetical protein